ncbi:MAG TPA: ABC transporter substrate-binding protein [Acetobacteraceae bacterium]|jgi:peptide/nickel transport system substrate-binding protein
MTFPSLSRRAALAGLGAIGLAARARAQASGTRPNIVLAVQENPDLLDPFLVISNVAYRVQDNIYDYLIATDYLHDLKQGPMLATEWHRTDDLTLEFTLRQGVKFHDGSEMTAEDVAFTFGPERMLSPQSRGYAPSRPFLGTIDRAEVIGPYKVRILTKQPDPLIERRLAGWGAQIVSKKAFLAAKDWDAWGRAPVGTGPYKVSQLKGGESILLTAHDDYWAGRPPAASIKFQIVPEIAARMAGLSAGDYDLITEVPPDQFKTVESDPNLQVVGGPILNHRVLLYDKFNPQLADVHVRRALSLAIDRQLLVDTFWQGRVTVTHSMQLPSFGALYNPDRPIPAFDPDRARAELKLSKYDGTVIPYRVIGSDYYPNEVATAQALIGMWKDVGINVELVLKENFAQVFQPPGRGICNTSDTALYPDPVSELWRRYGKDSTLQVQYKFWSDDEFNALGPTLVANLDPKARYTAFQKMLDIYDNDDPPGTVLHTVGMFYAEHKSLHWLAYPVEHMDFRKDAFSAPPAARKA